jgi:FAD/FMN-containing dehydrogenase
MRNMKDIQIIKNYKSAGYNGPAAKAGPGAIGGEIYEAVHAQGYLAVGGDCPSVGWGGGYTQGGGHSLLNSVYGMAADQVLEWEVITPQGKHLVATPTQNADLYWALSGGGGGTFGVVLSMKSKIYPENKTMGGGTLKFNNSVVGNETYWKAVRSLLAHLPTYVDGGNSFDFEIAATAVTVNSMTMLGGNASTVEAMVAPFLSELDGFGIAYEFNPVTSATYYDHFSASFGPLPFGSYPGTTLFSSRLIPRKSVETDAGRTNLTDALAATLNDEFYLGCHALNVKKPSHPDNAVNPAWREAITICIYLGLWDWRAPFSDNLANRQHLVEYVLPTMEAATPGGGVYLNEVDSGYQGNWRQEFYGSNYDRLLRVKDKYDPDHALWGWTAIGSDYWALDEDSRLCRA